MLSTVENMGEEVFWEMERRLAGFSPTLGNEFWQSFLSDLLLDDELTEAVQSLLLARTRHSDSEGRA